MAHQRILVMGGDLLISSGTADSYEPAIAFPLVPVSPGTAAIHDWRGCAWVENGRVCIEAGATVHEYAIQPATANSVNYLNGWRHAAKQKIRREPNYDKISRQYWDGWYDCWKQRR